MSKYFYIAAAVLAAAAGAFFFFKSQIINFLKKLYGDFDREELKKFSLLALIFGFTIGVYWLLRILKDGVFIPTVGQSNLPLAKMASLVFILPLVICYSKLVDKFPRHRIFYALCTIYGILTFIYAYLFVNPTFGLNNIEKVILPNGDIETHHVLAFGRFIGWSWYVFVESFGSLMVALFWAFAADTTTPESAKKGYSLVAMGAQVGAIVGAFIIARFAEAHGNGMMAVVGGISIISIALMIMYFMKVIPKDQLTGYHAKEETTEQKSHEKADTGFMAGLKLMISQPYLLGIFLVISLYEVIVTIFDFQLKSLAGAAHLGKGAGLTAFLGEYGVWVNTLSLVCILLGINNIGRKLGLSAALMFTPILVGFGVLALWFSQSIQVAWWVMVLSKAVNYALNQPSKEQLYIPTTKDTKYKAKAWTEMFGSRSSKAGGSLVNHIKKYIKADSFILASSLVSLGLVGIWMLIAIYLSKTHKQAVSEKKVVC